MRRRVLRSKKVCYLFTFILKQILQKIKNRIFAEAVGVFASFVENVFSTIATVRPILLVKDLRVIRSNLFIFPCLHGDTNVNNLTLNMTR